jgi:hypothetical protein
MLAMAGITSRMVVSQRQHRDRPLDEAGDQDRQVGKEHLPQRDGRASRIARADRGGEAQRVGDHHDLDRLRRGIDDHQRAEQAEQTRIDERTDFEDDFQKARGRTLASRHHLGCDDPCHGDQREGNHANQDHRLRHVEGGNDGRDHAVERADRQADGLGIERAHQRAPHALADLVSRQEAMPVP